MTYTTSKDDLKRTKGLNKIGGGLLTAIGLGGVKYQDVKTSTKSFLGKTFRPQIDGSKIIAQGIKHLFGKSDVQKHEAYIAQYVDMLHPDRKDMFKHTIVHLSKYLDIPQSTSGITKEMALLLNVHLINKLELGVVGVQPMDGPVSLVYFLEQIKREKTEAELKADPVGGKYVRAFQIVSTATEANSRRLQANWTIEAKQDLMAVHGIDFETELINAVVWAAIDEVHNEIVSKISTIAKPMDLSTHSDPAHALQLATADIAMDTFRGMSHFVIASPITITTMQVSKLVKRFVSAKSKEFSTTLQYVGTMFFTDSEDEAGIDVFTHIGSVLKNHELLVGYKGRNGQLDTGLTYCPYTPIVAGGYTVDSATFAPRMSLVTRAGFAAQQNAAAYYRKVTVANPLDVAKNRIEQMLLEHNTKPIVPDYTDQGIIRDSFVPEPYVDADNTKEVVFRPAPVLDVLSLSDFDYAKHAPVAPTVEQTVECMPRVEVPSTPSYDTPTVQESYSSSSSSYSPSYDSSSSSSYLSSSYDSGSSYSDSSSSSSYSD